MGGPAETSGRSDSSQAQGVQEVLSCRMEHEAHHCTSDSERFKVRSPGVSPELSLQASSIRRKQFMTLLQHQDDAGDSLDFMDVSVLTDLCIIKDGHVGLAQRFSCCSSLTADWFSFQ